ncbi:MAG: 4'-phosphopantetheinyl transferase superfamily protein, partial [Bifidobacteriaceae bacterium]|nr:4'-phosphopantetheinyl transferase superfamily protein [Bifidobacteriaceae bacterium]
QTLGGFWRNLRDGVDSIVDAPPDVIEPFYFDAEPGAIDRFYCNRGGFLEPFSVDPVRYGVLPIAASGADPDQLFSFMLAEEALRDSGVLEKETPLDRACVIVGRGDFAGLPQLWASEIIRGAEQVVGLIRHALPALPEEDLLRIKREYQAGWGRYGPDTATSTMPNLIASGVANLFGMHGPAYTVDAACASGLLALEQGLNLLRGGQCDIAVVSAQHTSQSSIFWSAFNLMGALSHKGEISPFSADADGLLSSQGGGCMVVKTLDRAIADQDRIYAVVKGTAVGSDGAGASLLVTNADGQTRVLREAWRRAGMDPDAIGYVEGHGTGTPTGDATEIETLTRVFGDSSRPPAYLGSVKSNIGHLMPAAGMMGLIKASLALYHRQIPQTLHCERPAPAVLASRFTPPGELIDWEESGLPLVAGVNAFGFGGIDAHAVLTAYQEPARQARRNRAHRSRLARPDVVAYAAPTKEALLSKFAVEHFAEQVGSGLGAPDDPYRLVVMNPTPERLAQAAALVEANRPSRGPGDIWFTNRPLLAAGGKIAFLFAGWDYSGKVEHQAIADELDIPFAPAHVEGKLAQEQADHLAVSLQALAALAATGVAGDVYAGHSMGEWNAAAALGILDSGFNRVRAEFAAALGTVYAPEFAERFQFASVNALNRQDELAQIVAARPGVHVVNDNGPSQSVLCVLRDSFAELAGEFKRRGLFCLPLAFGSGLHGPYVEDVFAKTVAAMEAAAVGDSPTPLWSSVAAGRLDLAGGRTAREVFGPHLFSQVRFRSMIERLHEEAGATVFIQVGPGVLPTYVDDSLRGRDFAAVASMRSGVDSVEQLRRVHAMVFAEGGPADLDFLGIPVQAQTQTSIFKFPSAEAIKTELPAFTEAVEKHYVPAGAAPAGSAPRGLAEFGQAGSPIAQAVQDNLQGAVRVQADLARAFASHGRHAPRRAGTRFELPLDLVLEDYPFLLDHSVVSQPPDWPIKSDLRPVVPLTMSLELMAEIAMAQAPGLKVLKISSVTAMQFMDLNEPFHATVKGHWKQENTVALFVPGYLSLDVTLGTEFPEPPEGVADQYERDLGADAMEPLTAEQQYTEYSFHHPKYWPLVESKRFGVHGFHNVIVQREGKGSLLDNMGCSVGLFLHLYETDPKVSFPIRLSEIAFYQDMFDQSGVFDAFTVVRNVTPNFIEADIAYLRQGQVWAMARGWINQRIETPKKLWKVLTQPALSSVAEQIAPGVHYFRNRVSNRQGIMFMLLRYLDGGERERYFAAGDQSWQADFLYGRIAVKDAVRAYSRRDGGPMLYPIEVSLEYDQAGKPRVVKTPDGPLAAPPHISLSHKGGAGAAMAGDRPVGIDLEQIAPRDESFMRLAFSEAERGLIAARERPDEWATRFWVAKEAVGKLEGGGLGGDPKRARVTRVDGERVEVNGIWVTTTVLDGDVIGWAKAGTEV